MTNFCKKCGSELPEGVSICQQCGTPVNNAEKSPVAMPAYQQPNSNARYASPVAFQQDNSPLGIGDYIVMMLVTAIPIVGFIMLLVWGFGSSQNQNRKNYARAALIMLAIGVVLSFIFGATVVAFFVSTLSQLA